MADNRLATARGELKLERYPAHRQLQAWCAADRLLIDAAAQHQTHTSATHCLVVNDDFGALCCALEPASHWTDSALAAIAVERNRQANSLPSQNTLWSTQAPPGSADLVVMRVPKQLPYFEYQLAQLARCMPTGSTLLAGGMDKHLSPRTAELIERHIGPTQRHRGQHKARLFSATRSALPPADYSGVATYPCPEAGGTVTVLANGFSREQLDIGSRLLLQYLPELPAVDTAVDLACGNGVLGLAALQQGLASQVYFCDESAMAIGAATSNCDTLQPEAHVGFHHGDGLRHYAGPEPQLILCNPPFHSGHSVNEAAGRRLLRQACDTLSTQGSLCVVANRHLNYQGLLQRSFCNVTRPMQNRKFALYLASGPKR
jgi:16S rRNA G1207 methylase RsmC